MPENDHIKRLLSAISLHDDQIAYKELFVQLNSRLKQFAYSILKSGEEADELVSDIFINIWVKREQLVNIESPLLYFYTTVKNLAYSRINKLKRLQTVSPDDWLIQFQSIYFDPEQLMITEEMVRQIKKAVNDLPPRCKLIPVLLT
jgi:RNA polymerase sigma-70 factor (ECF subfamily)